MTRIHPVVSTAFRAEAAAAWPEVSDTVPGKALIMLGISRLVENGAAEWGWLPDRTIELRLSAGAVFHLRETEIERII